MIDWNSVVADIGPKLLRYFAGAFPREAAADLAQETLVRLFRKVEEGAFDPSRGNLRMLAFGIARFVRQEAWKASQRTPPVPEIQEPDARLPALRQAIRRLKEDEREIVLLYIDQELTLAEIGAILGMPLGTVKSHLHRAKESLKKILEVNHG